jgi:hypothetical protein
MANTGTDVTKTAIGNSMLTTVTKTLFSFEALKVARMLDEWPIEKLAAPVNPIIRYRATHTRIG